MALRELLATMERESSAQAEEIRQAAIRRAESMTAEGKTRLGGRREDAVQARALELRQESNRVLGEARRRVRAEVLTLQQEILQRIRREAVSRLPGLIPHEAIRSRLSAELTRARTYLAPGPLTVRVSSGLASHFSGNGHPGLAVTSDPTILSGFTVSSADGAVMVDETLEHRLDAMWPSLAIELAGALEES